MDLIFNDKSLDASILNRTSAKQVMTTFAETINRATSYGASSTVRTHGRFWAEQLATGYTMADWGNDNTVDLELRRRVKAYTGKAPFIEEIIKSFEDKHSLLVEFRYNGQLCLGLGAAFITRNPSVSLDTNIWKVDPIQVSANYLTKTEVKTDTQPVCNLYNPGQVSQNYVALQTMLETELTTGEDILAKATTIFKRIRFTPSSRKQLSQLTGNEKVFRFVVKHLLALNCQSVNWTNGNFNAGYPYPCSEESEATMNKYGDERIFTLDDGSKVTFTWHSKINTDKWRIYFSHYASSNTVTIPYIGKHLSTVGDPT